MNRTTGQRRYLTTNSTQTGFEIAATRQAIEFNTDLKHWQPATGTFKASQKIVQLHGRRGARIQFFGAGSENTTANYRLWLLRSLYSGDARDSFDDIEKVVDVTMVPLITDTSTITLSTLTGPSGISGQPEAVSASERFADTLTRTLSTTATSPPGPGAEMEAAWATGNCRVYSPTGNASPAELLIPDFFGASAIIIEFDLTGAESMNALIEITK